MARLGELQRRRGADRACGCSAARFARSCRRSEPAAPLVACPLMLRTPSAALAALRGALGHGLVRHPPQLRRHPGGAGRDNRSLPIQQLKRGRGRESRMRAGGRQAPQRGARS